MKTAIEKIDDQRIIVNDSVYRLDFLASVDAFDVQFDGQANRYNLVVRIVCDEAVYDFDLGSFKTRASCHRLAKNIILEVARTNCDLQRWKTQPMQTVFQTIG